MNSSFADGQPQPDSDVSRREFLGTAMAGSAALVLGDTVAPVLLAPDDKDAVMAAVAPQHNATVKMLQDWIALPSIAAENKNYPQGPE